MSETKTSPRSLAERRLSLSNQAPPPAEAGRRMVGPPRVRLSSQVAQRVKALPPTRQ